MNNANIGALTSLMAQSGASGKELEATREIESMPGGMEMLFTMAADQGKAKGGSVKKVRMYQMGGAVKDDSGLGQMAETVRAGGRGEDDVLLHVSDEEFEAIRSMWGDPETNPVTGLPEYGFLSKGFKKLKKAVKKIVKSPVFKIAAPIALSVFAPGLGTAIGAKMGLSGAAASMAGNAAVQGGLGALGGGKKGLLQGALSGAVAGGLGSKVGSSIGLKGNMAELGGSALAQGAGSALMGDGFMSGAVGGALQAVTRPTQMRMAAGIREGLGMQPHMALSPGVGGTNPITGEAVSMAGEPSPQTSWKDKAIKWGLPALGIGAALASGSKPDKAKRPDSNLPDDLGSTFGEPLPQLSYNRRQISSPADYYTYGQVGTADSGEHSFFNPNAVPGQAYDTQSPDPTAGPSAPIPQMPQFKGSGLFPASMKEEIWRRSQNKGRFAEGGLGQVTHRSGGHYYRGPGTGRSDEIEAMLSDGEYVMDAETVAMLGDGSIDAGAKRLDEMRMNLRKHKGKALSKGKFSPDAKTPETYMAKGGKVRKKLVYNRGGSIKPAEPNEIDTVFNVMAREMGVQV